MLKQKNAIIQLLRDDDPDTVRLVKEQLASGGAVSVPDLEELLLADDARVSAHAREVLGEIGMRGARTEFHLLCRHFREDTGLESACWLLSRAFVPGVEPSVYRAKLDAWGRELKRLLGVTASPRDRIGILSHYASERLGFKGNTDNYYYRDNSLLTRVIDTQQGIPISLSILYLLLAERAGMTLEGINLPGHFIVRHQGVLFDPFHGGRVLAMRDCAEILGRQKMRLEPAHLEAASARSIVLRVLANLLYVFQAAEDVPKQEQVVEWIHLLNR